MLLCNALMQQNQFCIWHRILAIKWRDFRGGRQQTIASRDRINNSPSTQIFKVRANSIQYQEKVELLDERITDSLSNAPFIDKQEVHTQRCTHREVHTQRGAYTERNTQRELHTQRGAQKGAQKCTGGIYTVLHEARTLIMLVS